MFFSISQTKKENFPNQHNIGNIVVNTDNGWTLHNDKSYTVLYKGYVDFGNINEILDDIIACDSPRVTGNFCAIVYYKEFKTVKIKSDLHRSFPIYVTDIEITNLVPSDKIMWTDSLVTISENFNIVEDKFDAIGNIDTTKITVKQAADSIIEIIDAKTENLIKNSVHPIRAFLSGGVDSLLVYSFLQKHTSNIELVKSEHFDYDYFTVNNSRNLKKFWAYNQIHHWTESCILATGAPGDEFMLRSPTTANMYLINQGTNIPELLDKNPNVLHRDYFLRDKHLEIFNQQTQNYVSNKNTQDIHWELCNIVNNDWQHWHLGNTLTWTPLRDLEIFKLILRLPLSDAIGQIFDSQLSKYIIEKNMPGGTKLISNQKNDGAAMKNLCTFLNLPR